MARACGWVERVALLGLILATASIISCGSDEEPADDPYPTVGGGGFTSTRDNQYPCDSAEPVGGQSSGLLECDNGLLVRPSAGECSSSLPRDGDVDDYQFGIDQCQNDSGCAQYPNGFCRRLEEDHKATCGYGCLTDSDCQSPLICLCAELVGLCVEAGCSSDSECVDGYHCAYNEACERFACQHEDDECATDDDCDEGRCVVAQQRRKCAEVSECDD
jgi:hypothetical protein